jgi:hypothetical protein
LETPLGILWSKSGTIERDNNDNRTGGALAYFYQGNTTTPITVYQDADETTPHAHPVAAASSGRWPTVFIPFRASYDLKVTTSSGTQLYYPTEIPNPNPVEAAEDSVDDSELIQTGDIVCSPATGARTGFVRLNGRTIGSASSGATERANADTEDLYTFNWNNFSNTICPVATGRGASAAADFAANKALTLIDARSAFLCGADDMGNSAASLGYGGSFTTGDATTGGSTGGANTHTLTTAELAAHTHGAGSYAGDSGGAHSHTISITDPGHTHAATSAPNPINSGGFGYGPTGAALGGAGNIAITVNSNTTGITASSNSTGAHTHSVSGTSGSSGSGGAHNNMPRHIVVTYYQKL